MDQTKTKLAAIVLAVVMTVLQLPVGGRSHAVTAFANSRRAEERTEEKMLGDADGDGYLTTADARLILRYSAHMDPLPDGDEAVLDLDDNGKSNAGDSRRALRRAALLDTEDSALFATVRQPDFDEPVSGTGAFSLSVSDRNPHVGDTITVTARLDDATGFTDGAVFLRFDPERLENLSCITDIVGAVTASGQYAENAISAAVGFIDGYGDDSMTFFRATFRAIGSGTARIDHTFTDWNGIDRPSDGYCEIDIEEVEQTDRVDRTDRVDQTGWTEGTFDGAEWRYEDGVLSFSGTSGETYDISCIPDENERMWWKQYDDEVRTVVFDRDFRMVYLGQAALAYKESLFNDMPLLEEFRVDENNEYLRDIDGVLFSKDGTELIRFPRNKNVSAYTIPATVTSIGCEAFCGCAYLKQIEVPESVSEIEGSAIPADALTVCCAKGSAAEQIAIERNYPYRITDGDAPAPVYGDANNDGTVKAGDARTILRHAAKVEIQTDPFLLKLMDVDGNGSVKAADARLALRMASRIDPTRPYTGPEAPTAETTTELSAETTAETTTELSAETTAETTTELSAETTVETGETRPDPSAPSVPDVNGRIDLEKLDQIEKENSFAVKIEKIEILENAIGGISLAGRDACVFTIGNGTDRDIAEVRLLVVAYTDDLQMTKLSQGSYLPAYDRHPYVQELYTKEGFTVGANSSKDAGVACRSEEFVGVRAIVFSYTLNDGTVVENPAAYEWFRIVAPAD